MTAGLNHKSVWYPLSFSPRELPEELFAEKNFSTTQFNRGIFQSIQSSFKIKILPWKFNRYTWNEAEDVAVAVIVKR